MIKFAPFLAVILCFMVSCVGKTRPETEEVAFWNAGLLDSTNRILYKEKDTSAALAYFDSVLNQYSEPPVYPKASRYIINANYHYFFTGNNIETAKMIDSALDLFNTPGLQHQYPKTYVGLLLFGGRIAYRLTQYSKANDYYFRARKLADDYLDPCERKDFNYSIAMVLYRQHNFRESLNYFKEAYAQQSTCLPQTAAVILQQQEIQSNIGLCHVHLKNYDSAVLHFDRALKISEQNKDSLGPVSMDKIRGVIYGNKAMVAIEERRLDEAEALSRKSIFLNDREGYEMENALHVKLQLAKVYHRKKEFGSMFNILQDINMEKIRINPKLLLERNRLLANYYENTDQTREALQHFKAYFSLHDSIEAEQVKLMEADVERQLSAKEQELLIAKLEKNNQVTTIWLWVTVIFIIMAFMIIILVNQNSRRNKKNLAISLSLNKEIELQKHAREKEAKQRHKLITEAVIVAQEKERSLIGLELHDNINQVLTTVKLLNEMVLEGAGDPKIFLPKASLHLQDCINEIRSLSKRLSAPTLGKISLEESVRDLVDSINMTSKVKIERRITGMENTVLNKDLHLALYRILQEQLNNVIKHAEASEVMVSLDRNQDKIRLSISDNGKGFTWNGNKGGIGMMNMQTRAENLNGTFELNSSPGKGCTVEVLLPLG